MSQCLCINWPVAVGSGILSTILVASGYFCTFLQGGNSKIITIPALGNILPWAFWRTQKLTHYFVDFEIIRWLEAPCLWRGTITPEKKITTRDICKIMNGWKQFSLFVCVSKYQLGIAQWNSSAVSSREAKEIQLSLHLKVCTFQNNM